MNYQHLYHAGNPADVAKHSLLSILLQHFLQKETPFYFIDSHAGFGRYDLSHEFSQKTGEALAGLGKFQEVIDKVPEVLLPYRDCITHYEKTVGYPGSPLIARYFLRPQDKAMLNELHPEAFRVLKKNYPEASLHQRDAYEFLPAVLNPSLKRALVLVDPPFEKKDERKQLREALEKSVKKFPTACFLVWLPLTIESQRITAFSKNLAIPHNAFHIFHAAGKEKGLIGSGFILINPPFGSVASINMALDFLEKCFK
jgi:23S rRNA (adenine2030-N6)-methyltransferase